VARSTPNILICRDWHFRGALRHRQGSQRGTTLGRGAYDERSNVAKGNGMLEWLAVPLGALSYLSGRHFRRYTRLRRGAVQRLAAVQRGESVTVPVLYEDAAGREPTSIPSWLNGYLTVQVTDGKLTPGSGHPALFGDFVEFWTHCVDDATSGHLPVLTEPNDVLVQPRLPYPKGARAFVVVAPEDWRILTSAEV
jgi:hypothetical protein